MIKNHTNLLKYKINDSFKFNTYIELARAYRGINDKKKSLKYLLLANEINPKNYGLNIHFLKHFTLENNINKSIQYYSFLFNTNTKPNLNLILKQLIKENGWDNHEMIEIKEKITNIK